jgi:flagellar hook-associated protein 3 FlgL
VFGGGAAGGAPLAPSEALLDDVGRALAGTLVGPIPPAVDPPSPEAQLDHYFGVAPLVDAPAGTTFAENIWRGGDGEAPPVELADGDRLAYAVRGDATPLVDLMRQLAVIASVEGAPGTTFPDQAARLDAWQAAATNLLGAVDAITAMRGDLGADERRIDEAGAAQEAEKATLTAARARLIGRDEYETATLVRQLETQLETVYAMTARTFQLSLLNYLR